MRTMIKLTLSSLSMLMLAGFTLKERATPVMAVEPSSYLAELHGDVHVSTRGEARFGVVKAEHGAPTVFTLSLGANGSEASVLFTRTNGARVVPGTYAIGGQDNGSDEILALIMTGTVTHPTGVFRGRSGYLIISSVTDNVIRGRFQVDGRGFLASSPEDETREIRATGMFTATRQ